MKKHSSKNTSEFYNELVKGKNKFTFSQMKQDLI